MKGVSTVDEFYLTRVTRDGLDPDAPVTKVAERVELLTGDELRAMDLTVELVNLLSERIVGDGPSREGDLREIVFHVHGIQQRILKQAAARAYPARFRLLGRLVGDVERVTPTVAAQAERWAAAQTGPGSPLAGEQAGVRGLGRADGSTGLSVGRPGGGDLDARLAGLVSGDLASFEASAKAVGYDLAVAELRGVVERTGSPAARWAADYLAASSVRSAALGDAR